MRLARPSVPILLLLTAMLPADDIQEGSWEDPSFAITEGVAWEMPWSPDQLQLERGQTAVKQVSEPEEYRFVQVSLCDLDCDGDLDAVYRCKQTATGYYTCVEFWENAGAGQWIRREEFYANKSVHDVEAADMDLDGTGDLVEIRSQSYNSAKLILHAGFTNWNWDYYGLLLGILPSYASGSDACITDLNSDGYPDIVSTYEGYSLAYWKNEHGVGLFSLQEFGQYIFTDVRRVRSADIEPDGDNDLLVRSSGGACVLRNEDPAGPSFTTEYLPGASYGTQAQFADLDGDGSLEVVLCSDGMSWYGHSGGGEWQQHDIPTGAKGGFATGDVDGDGRDEIVAVQPEEAVYPSPAVVLEMDGSGNWTESYLASCRYSETALAVGDHDGSGTNEVFIGRRLMQADAALADSGNLVSTVFDTGVPDNQWGIIDWSATVPSGSQLYFRVRGYDEPGSYPGSWSPPITTPGTSIGQYLQQEDTAVQYQVCMTGSPSGETPLLDYVILSFTPLGAGPEAPPAEAVVRPLLNPAIQPVDLELALPETGPVTLSVYDVSGRLACRPVDGSTLSRGVHRCILSGLDPGVYLLRLDTERETSTARMVVCR
jgi:hypothetical protein